MLWIDLLFRSSCSSMNAGDNIKNNKMKNKFIRKVWGFVIPTTTPPLHRSCDLCSGVGGGGSTVRRWLNMKRGEVYV